MTVSDVTILGKKILVGIVVTIVPFIIIFGGLWITPRLLSKVDNGKSKPQITDTIKSKATS